MRADRRFRLTFAELLAFSVVAVPVVVALRSAMSTIDLAYQIRAGEVMLDTGNLLRTDVFTFTAFGQPWLNQQWGAQIVLALLFRAGSWELIALAQATLAGLSFWLLFLACRARGVGDRTAAWLTLAALLVAGYGLSPRPQLLGFALFALALWIVAGRERRARAIWLLPPIALVWANLHGSFVLIPVVALLTGFDDLRRGAATARPLLVAAGVSIVAATVNPFGIRVWSYLVDLSTNPEVRRTIEEWQPPRPLTYTGGAFFLSVIGVCLILVRHRKRLDWTRTVGLAFFLALGVSAVRGVIWWALAAPVLISDLLPRRSSRDDEPRTVNTVIAATLVALAVVLLPWFRPMFTSSANSTTATDGLLAQAPVRYSDEVLRSVEPGTRVFVPQLWASWFELEVPEVPVMVDPRIEVFGGDVWRDYDLISDAEEGWEAVLDRWNIDVLVLSQRQQSALISAIESNPHWRVVRRDADGLMLVRR